MKNKVKIFGIIAIVAIIGFSMAACDSGGDSGGGSDPALKFEGMWKMEGFPVSWTFTGNNFLYQESVSINYSMQGTFTFTDSTITFTTTSHTLGSQMDPRWMNYTQNYTLSGNELTLEWDNIHNAGTYIKQ